MSQLRVVVDLSFLERPDGWPGLVTTYGLMSGIGAALDDESGLTLVT